MTKKNVVAILKIEPQNFDANFEGQIRLSIFISVQGDTKGGEGYRESQKTAEICACN